jgi:hypothetical protein
MTIRTGDVTVDFSASPRIITVKSPITEFNIQDIYDTLKFIEATNAAMDDKPLIDAAGKENLGGGVAVGLTATLLNALLAFEARPGPAYVQCRVAGGNLVAVDDVGAYFNTPISPTAFTQVVTTASSSATTQNQASLEFSTFGGAVHVDAVNGTALNGENPLGSLIGNPQFPVNNVPDAVIIDSARGLGKNMKIIGDITFDTGDILDGFFIKGQNANRTSITVNEGASMLGVEIQEAYVTGNLDGECILRFCSIQNLNYVNGYIYTCVISPGYITLSGTTPALIMDCKSGVPGLGTPVIRWIAGQDTPLAIRGYDGGIELQDKTGGADVSVDLAAGQVKIKNTCTNGTIVVRGDGKCIDADTGAHMGPGIYNGNLTVVNEASFGGHLHDLWERMGLDPAHPMLNRTDGSFTSDNIDVTATIDGSGNITHQRQ